jgi:phenylacetate-CoA ligase
LGTIAVSIYSPFLYFKRFGLKSNLEFNSEDDYFNAECLSEKLVAVHEKFQRQILKKSKLIRVDDFTDKNYFVKNMKFFDKKNNLKTVKMSTSGTTGQGLKFEVTQLFMRKQWEVFEKQFREASVLGTWRLQFSGRDLKILGLRCPVFLDFYEKKVFANQYCLNSGQVNFIMKIVKCFNITWIHGYPSMVVDFIQQVTNSKSPTDFPFNKITVTLSSETFTAQQKEYLNNKGITRVYDMYGQSEGVANFFTCKHGWMHVNESFSLVEFIPSGDLFEIVGTSLHNNALTFYRYKTGDFVEKVFTSPCDCGRHSRRILNVLGRQDDYVVLKDGSKVGRLDHLTKGDMRVHQAQIVQEIKGSFTLNIACDPDNFADLKQSLMTRCLGYFGDRADVEIKHVSKFIISRAGKWKFVVNLTNDK